MRAWILAAISIVLVLAAPMTLADTHTCQQVQSCGQQTPICESYNSCYVESGDNILADSDGDGVADCVDNCPCSYNPNQENVCSSNGDDQDDDNGGDDGPTYTGEPVYCSNLANPCTADDPSCYVEEGDNFVPDSDRDGVADAKPDNCICNANSNQADSNNDGVGDACSQDDDDGGDDDPTYTGEPVYCSNLGNPCTKDDSSCYVEEGDNFVPDSDRDGVADAKPDNCICNANPSQKDSNNNGIGDACDTITPPTGISLSKTASSSTINDGQQVTYTLTVSGVESRVSLTDSFTNQNVLTGSNGAQLQADYTSVQTNVQGQGSISGSLQQGFQITNLDGTATVTYQASATATNTNDQIVNTAQANNRQDSQTITIRGQTTPPPPPPPPGESEFRIIKGVSDRFPDHNQRISYSIAVQNIGDGEGSITVTDSINQNYGVLEGNNGGEVRYEGNEVITARKNGRSISVQSSGSVVSSRGVTLYDVPAQSTVTISYQARVSSDDMARTVTSIVENTAGNSDVSDTVGITLRGTQTTPTPSSSPATLTNIPTQVLQCGEQFPTINLDEYVLNAGDGNYRLSVSGNRNLQVALDQATNQLSVSDPQQQGAFTERLTLTLTRQDGTRTSQTITYNVLESFSQTPILTGIPNQIIDKDDSFESFRLADYVQVANPQNLNYYAVGSELLSVQIDDSSRVTIDFEEDLFENMDLAQISEAITFGVVGCSETEDTAVFTAINDDLGDYDDYPYVPNPRDRTCAIRIDRTLYDDTDCDGIIDIEDNCAFTSNPDQTDSNRDGVGDACDVVVSCFVQETNLAGGRVANVEVLVENNLDQDLGNMRVNANIPDLGASRGYTIAGIAAGTAEQVTLRPRIPVCAQPQRYSVECSVQGAGIRASQNTNLRISESPLCQATSGSSEADVYEVQDVIAGSMYGASFPITIRNNEQVQKSYILRAEGVTPWGDHVFESGNVVVVAPGQETRSNLRVYAPQELSSGEYPFRVSISSGSESQDVLLVANVIEKDNVVGFSSGSFFSSTFTSIMILLIVLVSLALLLGLHKK